MPNMATMLAFITTDAKVEKSLLQKILFNAVDISFNKISVDGETSTNDMVTIMANGVSGVEINTPGKEEEFQKALNAVSIEIRFPGLMYIGLLPSLLVKTLPTFLLFNIM